MNISTTGTATPGRLRAADYLLLILLSAALYGTAAFSGRPLSVHEARVPQLAREMVAGESDWVLPQSGGRPWLERPPLPHWFTAASMLLFRRDDSLWAARLPAAVAGCATVLMAAWMASRWFGRGIGLLCGAVVATTYELYQYATLAEDDVYLGLVAVACVAMFVRTEWPRRPPPTPVADAGCRPGIRTWVVDFVGPRPWPTILFYVLLGLTNLAKGPLVGALPIVGTVAVYLLWNRDGRRVRHYAWLWGWLIFLALTLAWPWWAWRHYPDVVDNWRFDYLGRVEGGATTPAAATKWDEAPWYYVAMLPMALAPWTWSVVVGLFATARRAWRVPGGAERFLWCWAWVGLIVLSLPARKHHHYLVPIVTPWAILGALGLLPVGRLLLARDGPGESTDSGARHWLPPLVLGLPAAIVLVLLRRKIPGGAASAALLAGTWVCCVWMFVHGLARRKGGWLVGSVVVGFALCAGWVQSVVAGRDPVTVAEGRFLDQVAATVPPDQTVLINADIGSLRFFGVQFRLHRRSRLLHNLSFLRDRTMTSPDVYVITQARDQPTLDEFGASRLLAQANSFRPKESPAHRLTLFHVTLAPDLARYDRPRYVGVMEAMGRRKGPWCGPELPAAGPP